MKRHDFTKDTSDMFNDIASCLYSITGTFSVCSGLLKVLSEGDMDGIRKAFKDGLTPFLVPDLMETFDGVPETEEIEIRVTHHGKTIGILVSSDINW